MFLNTDFELKKFAKLSISKYLPVNSSGFLHCLRHVWTLIVLVLPSHLIFLPLSCLSVFAETTGKILMRRCFQDYMLTMRLAVGFWSRKLSLFLLVRTWSWVRNFIKYFFLHQLRWSWFFSLNLLMWRTTEVIFPMLTLHSWDKPNTVMMN